MKPISIIMTCSACPSQWEGKLDDGRMFYARYRFGYLSFRVSDNITDDVYDAVKGNEVYGNDCGDSLDGSMNTQVMKMWTKEVIEWDKTIIENS